MNFEKPIKESRRMSELITVPRLVPIVRHSGYSYNVLVVVTVIVAIFLGMAKILFGALFFQSCRLQPLIPVYLIVDSCFGLLILWTIENKDKKIALRMQLVLALIQTVGLVFGTIWVIEVSQELYDADHCAVTAPTAASLTTAPLLIVNITVVATTLTCATCSIALVKFTTAVVVIQWLIALLAMFNGAIVILQRYFSEGPASDCYQTTEDNESKQPIINP